MKGYIILVRDLESGTLVPVRHKLTSNQPWFPYVIFETHAEAQHYSEYNHAIRKVNITINKTEMNLRFIHDNK